MYRSGRRAALNDMLAHSQARCFPLSSRGSRCEGGADIPVCPICCHSEEADTRDRKASADTSIWASLKPAPTVGPSHARPNCHPEEAWVRRTGIKSVSHETRLSCRGVSQADEGSTAASYQPRTICTWRYLRGSTGAPLSAPGRGRYACHHSYRSASTGFARAARVT